MARTGYKITVYMDDNPNSPTYGETFEVRELDTVHCPTQGDDDLELVSNECEIDISGMTGYRLLIYWNNTTQEYLTVREKDTECEPSSSDEQWVNSGTPYCEVSEQGLNTGYMLQLQVQMNPILPNYRETKTLRYKSNECGNNGCAIWDDIQMQCHLSIKDCVVTFDGTADVTQIDVNPLSSTFNKTRTINKEDSSCQNCVEATFSWVEVGQMCGDDSFLCQEGEQQVGTTKYTVSQKYKTIGSETYPMGEYQLTVFEEESEDCGFIRPQYQWSATTQYICDFETYTKYRMEVMMVSYDQGITWSVDNSYEPRRGEVIAEESYDCGKPMYRWVETDEYICLIDREDYSSQYLTIESLEDGNKIEWDLSDEADDSLVKTISASTNNGVSWTEYTSSKSGTTITILNKNEKLLLKGDNASYGKWTNQDHTRYLYTNHFGISKPSNVYGNIMSLVYGDDFEDEKTLTESETFPSLFSGCKIISADNLILPATTLTEHCYNSMFHACTSLTAPPHSIGTNDTIMARSSCQFMFSTCTSLTTASRLPSTTLAVDCYGAMFMNCTSLTTAPQLPSMILAENCYGQMFEGCTSLTTAPTLPSTTLADNCYERMFYGCTSLTIAPQLPATTLAESCYGHMFWGCSSLTTAPTLPSTTLAVGCYGSMFKNCTSLTTAPELRATMLATFCYQYMFDGCTSLNYIKMLATDISAYHCLNQWVEGVSSSGTFVKTSSMTTLPSGSDGIPSGWNVENV